MVYIRKILQFAIYDTADGGINSCPGKLSVFHGLQRAAVNTLLYFRIMTAQQYVRSGLNGDDADFFRRISFADSAHVQIISDDAALIAQLAPQQLLQDDRRKAGRLCIKGRIADMAGHHHELVVGILVDDVPERQHVFL